MPRNTDHLVQIVDVTTSSCEDGDTRVNLGDSIKQAGVAAEAPFWSNGAAFIARPADPDAAGACEAMFLQNGNQKVVIASRDARYYAKAGELQPGDAAIVGPGEARLLRKVANDSLTIYTANQTDGDSSMLLTLIGETGKLLAAVGGSYLEMDKESITLSAGGSMLRVSSNGVEIFGKHFAANTKGGNLGVVGGIAPPQGTMSMLAGVSGVAGTPSAFWTVSLA